MNTGLTSFHPIIKTFIYKLDTVMYLAYYATNNQVSELSHEINQHLVGFPELHIRINHISDNDMRRLVLTKYFRVIVQHFAK